MAHIKEHKLLLKVLIIVSGVQSNHKNRQTTVNKMANAKLLFIKLTPLTVPVSESHTTHYSCE